MSESKEYWKELLGDSYNDELMSSIMGEDGSPDTSGVDSKPEQKPDSDGFVSFDLNSSAPELGVPGSMPDTEKVSPENNIPPVQRDGSRAVDDFKVDFDFDGEYQDVPEQKPIHQRRERRTGCLGGILYALFIICVSLAAASLLWMATTDVFGFGKESRTIEVTIPDNFDIDEVTDILYENNVIKYKKLFKLYAGFSHADKKISAGTYKIVTSYDYFALVNGLTSSGGVFVETDLITIPEGYTLKQIFEKLAANNVCSEDKLWECAQNYDFDFAFLRKSTIGEKYRLEGYLFPDTYKFYVNDDPERVIEKFLDNFDAKLTQEYRDKAAELGYTVQDILTIASLIEKEAAGDSERDLIASVIYNRLNNPDSFPLLQIDASIYYAIAETGEPFATDVDSPYNTYQHSGLPPTPIANPGIASIRAALYPQETDYYYYALSVSGSHEFFTYQDSFEEFVNSEEYGG